MSPNKLATAHYLLEHISEYGFPKTYVALRDGCIMAKTSGLGRGRLSKGSSIVAKSVGRSSKFSALREIITRIAYMMGVAGYSEYDYWSDEYDISVLAFKPGEEDRIAVNRFGEAIVEVPQVTAWLVAQIGNT